MNQSGGVNSGGAVPTGCYKCGRPGHWSRDCPSEANTTTTTTTSNNNNNVSQDFRADSDLDPNVRSRPPLSAQNPKQKQKPPRRIRPKLTPDLLLSDAGVGHILRYFPRALKCRGRGHEVDDLQHLLRLYADWHSRLMPYYNFEQFVDKVERVGATRRVKMCLRDLREKIANGADLTKLQESQVQEDPIAEQDAPSGLDMPSTVQENNMQTEDENNFQEDMPQSIWEEATQEPSQPVHVEDVAADTSRAEEVPDQRVETNPESSNKILMSEEQKARMEANKLRALERAAARSRLSHA